MALTNLNQRFYRYMVESFDILFEGEGEPTKILPSMINSILIEKDFDNDYFPILRVKVLLTTQQYYKILQNKETVKFRFRFQKFIYDSENTFKVKKDVFNEIFTVFLDENAPFNEKEMLKITSGVTSEGSSPGDAGGKEFTFFLWKEKDLNASKKIINNVVGPATMTNVLAYLLSTAGFSKILLAPLDNKGSYPEILLPPLTVLGNFEYLENQYGFYSTGTNIFFDLDRAYVLDYSGKCKVWAKSEYQKTTFNVKKDISADSLSPGTFDDTTGKTFYINIPQGSINMKALSMVTDQTDGNNYHYVDPKSGEVTTQQSTAAQRGKGTFRVVIDKFSNPYIRQANMASREENKNIAEINISDFDMDALSPNKSFLMTFEDSSLNKSHGGYYRMSTAVIVFTKQGEDFVVSANCSLKKS